MPVYGMLRVKNEEKYLPSCLQSIFPICDRVYVMDDHSTDRTVDIVKDHGYIPLLSPFEDGDLNEARDKTWLLGKICEDVPTSEFGPQSNHWVFQIDADEELVASDKEKFTPSNLGSVVDHWSVQILYLWDAPTAVRWDGHYAKCYRPSIFRLIRQGMSYNNHSGPLHPTGVPASHIGLEPRLHEPEPIRLLHYGYMEAGERVRKYDWYVARDKVQEPFYRTECFGPATLMPLTTVLR
jgi:glycosyltransferase involved in cell wall biosynthesis